MLVKVLWMILKKTSYGRFEWVRVQNSKRIAFLVKNIVIIGGETL
jgi:hypothetical protein